jgi:hypothetical protein
MGLGGIPQPKPARGSFRRELDRKQSQAEAEERRLKEQAKFLDGFRCRYPGCSMQRRYALHGAHLVHKGAGGDVLLIRTTLEGLIALCAFHHELHGLKQFHIQPMTTLGARGLCWFWDRPFVPYLPGSQCGWIGESRATRLPHVA